MMDIRRALLLGFFSWLVPFAASVLIFPLKTSHTPLFDNLMAAVVTATAVSLGCAYLRKHGRASWPAAAAVGGLWWGINVGFDLLMFSWGPMQMPAATYFLDIGLAYNIYPIVLGGLASVRPQTPTE